MRVLACLALLAACVASPCAVAAQVTVHITDTEGHLAPDAVITLIPQSADLHPASAPVAETRIIDQKDETFIPYVQIVRPGDPVVFRNSDDTRHHVYSFSPIKTFEFVLAPGESSTPFMIDSTGIAVVGCNIHDNMITYLFVSDAPWIAQTGKDGTAVIKDLPPGSYAAHVWHPQQRPGKPEVVLPVTLASADAKQTVGAALSLLPDPRMRMDHERMRY